MPGLGPLQPAEVLALPLFALAAARLRERGAPTRGPADLGVLAWLIGVLAAALLHAGRGGGLAAAGAREVGAALYLASLYGVLRVLGCELPFGLVARGFVVSCSLAAALGAAGTLLAWLGVPTPLAFAPGSPYPYLGEAARARALTATPNMLASLLSLALVLLAAGVVSGLPRPVRAAAGALCATGVAATSSKTAVALLAALAAVRLASGGGVSRARRAGLTAALVLAAAAYAAGAHVVVLPAGAETETLRREMFVAGEPLARVEALGRRFELHRTNYWYNKRASLIAIEKSWPWGIGPGRHPGFAGELKAAGLYPEAQWLGVPHSTLTGVPAELGLAGTLGLAGFALGLAAGLRRAAPGDATRPAAAGGLTLLLVEALATDVMHFRHLFWLAALLGSAARAPSRD